MVPLAIIDGQGKSSTTNVAHVGSFETVVGWNSIEFCTRTVVRTVCAIQATECIELDLHGQLPSHL